MKIKVLRHFLYLDVELVGAFLEQLEGGKVRVTESTTEAKKYVQGGLNIALMQLGGGGTHSTSQRETKTIYYDLYNRLENVLRNEKKLVDLSSSRKNEANRIKENQFFLAYGTLTFSPEWSNWKSVGYVLGKINDWMVQLQASEQEQQHQAVSLNQQVVDGARSLVLPDSRPVILLAPPPKVNVFPSLPEEPPEQLRPLVKPEEIQINIDLPDRQLKLVGSGFLENFGRDRIAELSTGPRVYNTYAMGLTSDLCEDYVRFTPLAIFIVI